jgi:lysophospholipase L1-like esterase
VQSANASDRSQPASYAKVFANKLGLPLTLPLIRSNSTGVVGSTSGRSRIDPALRALNLAVSGADVGSLLRDRADATIDTETDLVLSPRSGSQIEVAESLRGRLVLCWIGSNDALGAVTAFDHLDASQLTPVPQFTADFQEIVSRLKAAGSIPVFANIPDVVDIAFLMDRADLIRLLGNDGGLPAGSYTTIGAVMMVKLGLANASIFQDPNYVLDATEVGIIRSRINAFNTIIRNTATASGFAVVDVNAAFRAFAAAQPIVFGVRITSRFLGGLFSLDGVHPSNFGHAIVAGIFIKTMNARYGLTLPGFTQAEWLSIFTNDPFIDKDGDGKVKGRPGDGLLETLAPLLGFSGDSNDSLANDAPQSAEAGETAVQALEQSWGAHIPRASEDGNRAAAVAAVRRLLGLD